MRFRVGIVAWLLIVPVSLFASVPHSFEAGQPAKASEVNANFAALDDRVSVLEGGDSAAARHPYTYEPIDTETGSVVFLGGTMFIMVEMPFKEIVSGDHYRIKYPVEAHDCGCSNGIDQYAPAYISVTHAPSDDARPDIFSGFPAQFSARETYSYRVEAHFQGGGPSLKVETYSYRYVSVLIGETSLTLRGPSGQQLLHEVEVDGDDFDLTDDIDWEDVIHETFDLDVGRDWLNHIRIDRIHEVN